MHIEGFTEKYVILKYLFFDNGNSRVHVRENGLVYQKGERLVPLAVRALHYRQGRHVFGPQIDNNYSQKCA